MSTYLYLECGAHDPPIQSGDEVGQHLYNLPVIRGYIADREQIIADSEAIENAVNAWQRGGREWDADTYWKAEAMRFFRQHPHCPIAIVDEYGKHHPITADPDDE